MGKWAAVAGAVATPFFMSMFSYLEARDATKAARSQSAETEVIDDRATRAYRGANVGYQLVVQEFDRAWESIDECHERLGQLEAAVADHSLSRGLHRRTRRPAAATNDAAPAPMSKPKRARRDLPDDLDSAQRLLTE